MSFLPSAKQQGAPGTTLASPTSAMMGYTCSMHRAMMLGRKGLNTWPGSCTTTWRIFRNFSTTRQPVLPSWRMLSANCSLQTREHHTVTKQLFLWGAAWKPMLMASDEKQQKVPCCVAAPLLRLRIRKAWVAGGWLPGKHVEESLYDLFSERHTHLYSKAAKQSEEEAQHLISHI